MKNCGLGSWEEVPEDLGLAYPQPLGDVLGSFCQEQGIWLVVGTVVPEQCVIPVPFSGLLPHPQNKVFKSNF